MVEISIKNRLLAISVTIIASLLATAGLFFAINNLTDSLSSFEKISSSNTVLKIELFSPLLASIKNNKPITDFVTINSTLQQSLNSLANNNYKNDSLQELLGSQGHSMLSFVNNGDAYLVAEKNNKFTPDALSQPLFSNNKIIDDLIIYSNNKDLLNSVTKDTAVADSILISFNDLARVTVINNLFTSEQLTTPLTYLKNLLQPLSLENSSFSASIQQSNHRTKIQFYNLNNNTNSQQSSLGSLTSLLPRSTAIGFLSNSATTSINYLSGVVNNDLLSKYLTKDQPLLYADNEKKNWLIATISTDNKQIENLTALFANLYDIKTIETGLPDGSYAKEIKIKDTKALSWQNSSSQNISWQVKINKEHDLTIAKNENTYLAGNSELVNEVLQQSGYFPEDCKTNDLSTAILQKISDKTMYFSENSNKNAIFCIFN